MIEDRPVCPECGAPLSITSRFSEETGEFLIDLWCEGTDEDEFWVQINTKLLASDFEFLDVGETLNAEITLRNRNKTQI